MPKDLNFICLAGTLEKPPTIRHLASGLPVANAKLLIRSFFRTGDEVKERLSPISLVFYGTQLLEEIRLYESGDRLSISGELLVRQTSPTQARHTHEIVVRYCERVFPNNTANQDPRDVPEETRKMAARLITRAHFPVAGLLGVLALAVTTTRLGLRWNHTNSIPIGLYRTVPKSNIVVFCPDGLVSAESITRHYRSRGRGCPDGYEPIVKTVAALPGDSVAVTRQYIAINHHILPNTAPQAFDHQHRPMHQWQPGKYQVAPDTLWVLSTYNQTSYDSRYFGPIPISSVRAYVAPVWTFR